MIVTIDGPAGSGKSTAAQGLAERLNFHFLDTGAMYRAVALTCLQRSIDVADEAAVADVAASIEITFSADRVIADGIDVTDKIRTPDVTQAASVVAMNAGVRREMVNQQRQAAEGLDIVAEGRDQGTVVFPDAECKFFLTADPNQRAIRRQRDLQRQDEPLSLEVITAQIRDRDQRDENRDHSPLKPAADAIPIDTSEMDADEVLERLESIVRERM